MMMALPSPPHKTAICIFFLQTFCDKRVGPSSALAKLFFHACDLHVLHVVLTSSQTTVSNNTAHVTAHTSWRGRGGSIFHRLHSSRTVKSGAAESLSGEMARQILMQSQGQ